MVRVEAAPPPEFEMMFCAAVLATVNVTEGVCAVPMMFDLTCMAEVVAAELAIAVKAPAIPVIWVPETVLAFMFRVEPAAAFVIAVKRLAAELLVKVFAFMEIYPTVPEGMLMP